MPAIVDAHVHLGYQRGVTFAADNFTRETRADFIVLDANPLDDIANTQKINAVCLDGRKLDRAAMRAAFR